MPELHELETLFLQGTEIADLSPLSGLSRLTRLVITGSKVVDLGPLKTLPLLQLLASATRIHDLRPLTSIRGLNYLDLEGSNKITDLSPITDLDSIYALNVSRTGVSDLAPISGLTKLISGARSTGGLIASNCPIADKKLENILELENPERTIQAINYLREQQGLPEYPAGQQSDDDGRETLPAAIDGVPSPVDFRATEHGTITVAASDINHPNFPYPTSQGDHARRLEAARTLAGDVVAALSDTRYNARREYLDYLRNYVARLPHSAEDGDMLLADGQMRGLEHLFGADAEMLSIGLSSQLRALLEQHYALCAYYPQIGTFYRDAREGKQARPFPLAAATALSAVIHDNTPTVFEPPVAQAVDGAGEIIPAAATAIAPDAPKEMPDVIRPPPNPNGTADPKATGEFAKASTVNRLVKLLSTTVKTGATVDAVLKVAHDIAPYAEELLDWLSTIV